MEESTQSAVPNSWESLPAAVLGRCLRTGSSADELAAFSCCTSFMRALIAASPRPQITVQADEYSADQEQQHAWPPRSRALVALLQRLAAWDVNIGVQVVASILAEDSHLHVLQGTPGSLQQFLRLLHQEGVRMTRVKRVSCVGMVLDACAPAGLEAVFPNLQHLEAQHCRMCPGVLPLAACSNLQTLALASCSYQPAPAVSTSSYDVWAVQLYQLAGLPSLSSLSIDVPHYPTSYIPLWAAHLNALQLRNVDPLLAAPDAQLRWHSALSSTAHCTSLRKLTLAMHCTEDQLTMLPTLTQLQELQLDTHANADPDKFITALLAFPKLTQLSFGGLRDPQESYADHACSWKQIKLGAATPLLLSRLPLHSLASPLQLSYLDVTVSSGCAAAAATAAAAAANLARSGLQRVAKYAPSPGPWDTFTPINLATVNIAHRPVVGQQQEEDGTAQDEGNLAALLLAVAPLVPPDTSALVITGGTWDAALVLTLQQVMPPTFPGLLMTDCTINPSFWRQLALSFPTLKLLSLAYSDQDLNWPTAWAIMGYFSAACEHSAAVNGQTGAPQAACITLQLPPPAEDEDDDNDDDDNSEYLASFDGLIEQLRFMGLPERLVISHAAV